MELLSPLGGVYQAGTLSGNPLAMAAGLATLKILQNKNFYSELERKAAFLSLETDKLFTSYHIPHYCTRVGSMFCTYFTDIQVDNYQKAQQADTKKFARYFAGMIEEGIYLAPSQFEAGFISAAHKAPTGRPPPMIFPRQVRSGVILYKFWAPPYATRKPVITSSKMRIIPHLVHL